MRGSVEPKPGSINIIVACSENRIIGKNGRLPWRIKEDWDWFMNHTQGGANVIGRTSYEAMLRAGHVNGDRKFQLISRNKGLAGPWTTVHSSTEEALEAAVATGLPVWICGGTSIYEQTLPIADRLYLTEVHAHVEGDAEMPNWHDHFKTVLWQRESENGKFRYTFSILSR